MIRPAFALLPLLLAVLACNKPGDAQPKEKAGAGARKGPQAFAVEVQTVQERQLDFALQAIGSVVAYEEAQVTARVAGTVEKIDFTEGDAVDTEKVLVEIEPRRYKLAVDQARAAMARSQANVNDAKKSLGRRKQMGSEVATGEEIDVAGAKVHVADAEVAQARAALELAELNLRDAHVRSAVAGVVQTRKVQTGQYVMPGTVLATILRVEPLRIRFAVPEPDAQRLHLGMPAQFRVRGAASSYTAVIKHIAGKADEVTRLVDVLADIEGDRKQLRPGAFAEVAVPVGAPWPAPVIPQTAVRPSEKGFLAFTVTGGDAPKAQAGEAAKVQGQSGEAAKFQAQERVLQLGMRTTDGLVEVKSGLKTGETLVVIGAEGLRDGVALRIVTNKPGPGKERPRSSDLPADPTGSSRGP